MTKKTITKRPLGQTDIMVTPVGLGGNKFTGGKGFYGLIMPDLSQEEIDGIVKAALDEGINWFDTAELYGFGHSEQAIASALRNAGKPDRDIVIATKWMPFFRTAKNITRTIDKRIRFLDNYAIDLYMVHFPRGLSTPESQMEAMADLLEAGKIRSIGVSNFRADQMRRAYKVLAKRGIPLAANQVEYSLINRKIESNGVLDAAKELGVTIISWGPLGSGLLTGKFHKPDRFGQAPIGRRMVLRRHLVQSWPVVQALEEIASDHDASAAQIAVNWLVNFQGETVVAIPGASKIHHAEESARSMQISLSDQEMARLDELSREFC